MIPKDISFLLRMFREQWDTEILIKIIDNDKERAKKLKESYDNYLGKHSIIKDENSKDADNIYHREVVPYPNFIVKQVVGYLGGKPPKLMAEGKNKQSKYQRVEKNIKFTENNKEIIKWISSTSEGFIYNYLDIDDNYRLEIVPPWEMIILETKEHDYYVNAIRYYWIDFDVDDNSEKRLFVEYWYRDENNNVWVKHYLEDEEKRLKRVIPELYDFSVSNDIAFMSETDSMGLPGQFGKYIPFSHFKNNTELQTDFEVVQTLIDGNDLIHSDALRDLRRFANAIIKTMNARIKKEDVIPLKEQGLTVLNIVNENGEIEADAEWLIKDLSKLYEFLEWIVKVHHKEILLFSHRFDPTDEDFRLSYESIQYIIMMLENQSSEKEIELVKGWIRELEIISQIDNEIKPDEIEIKYYRNLPKEMKYYMEVIETAVKAGYPLEIALENTPFSMDIEKIQNYNNKQGEITNG